VKISKMMSALALVAAFGAVTVGCSDRSSSSKSRGPTVEQLTGDPDDEVTPQLQSQVQTAFARGENDEPVDF
jgi:hypothetical protein